MKPHFRFVTAPRSQASLSAATSIVSFNPSRLAMLEAAASAQRAADAREVLENAEWALPDLVAEARSALPAS